MKKLVVAERALADLRGISSYSKQEWGVNQSREYLAALQQAFARMREHPAQGAAGPELGAHYHTLLCGRHVIFYRDLPGHIEIARVLHTSMDIHRHIDPEKEKP